MSHTYAAVQWNRNKRVYDACLCTTIVAYLALFLLAGKTLFPGPNAISDEILAIRALGTCAYLLLHATLCIGPLARLDRRFLPLLYNRRHLGVATFVVAAAHGALSLGFYHGFGVVNPLISLFTSNANYSSLGAFPYQVLGFVALLILSLMAATSHDFWLKNLSPRVWKWLHMLIYAAYGLLVMHVALGFLQNQQQIALVVLVVLGVAIVATLHVAAGMCERRRDRGIIVDSPQSRASARGAKVNDAPWVNIGPIADIPENRGITVTIGNGERIAVFRHNGCISATTNVCAHQGGPLGEGRVVDGCITCPWHGWQYRAADGQSPPPFTEKIATHRVRIVNQRIEVDPMPCAPGMAAAPTRIE